MVVGITFAQIEARIASLPDGDQLWTDVDAGGVIATLAQQLGEDARAAAQIRNPGTGLQAAQSHERVDQLGVRLRREHVVFVRRCVRVEKRDFLALVLRGCHGPNHSTRGTGRGVISCPRKPLARSFGASSSAMCHEKISAASGWSSHSFASSTTGTPVPGMHLPIFRDPWISAT